MKMEKITNLQEFNAAYEGEGIKYINDIEEDFERNTPFFMVLDGIHAGYYFAKPTYININGASVKKPMTKPIPHDSIYFTVDMTRGYGTAEEVVWDNDEYDFRMVDLGIAHKLEKDAIQHQKALLSFTKVM
jgi:hypothetical protein